MGLVDAEKIRHDLKRPVLQDYDSWNAYHKELMEYLYLKFKDTYSNGDGKKSI